MNIIELNNQEHDLLMKIGNGKGHRVNFTNIHFHVLNNKIGIDKVNLTENETRILMDILSQIPGIYLDGEYVELTTYTQHNRSSLKYNGRIIAQGGI